MRTLVRQSYSLFFKNIDLLIISLILSLAVLFSPKGHHLILWFLLFIEFLWSGTRILLLADSFERKSKDFNNISSYNKIVIKKLWPLIPMYILILLIGTALFIGILAKIISANNLTQTSPENIKSAVALAIKSLYDLQQNTSLTFILNFTTLLSPYFIVFIPRLLLVKTTFLKNIIGSAVYLVKHPTLYLLLFVASFCYSLAFSQFALQNSLNYDQFMVILETEQKFNPPVLFSIVSTLASGIFNFILLCVCVVSLQKSIKGYH